MKTADCHIHMALDGYDWRNAIARHSGGVDETFVRNTLQTYRDRGITYLRDGGDRWGVGAAARELAPEYGIVYRTPLAPLHKKGHYGGFIGETFSTLGEYARLVVRTRETGGDFIKIMISGLMDFDCCGRLTEAGLSPEEIREMVHIAHEEGMAVMAHGNGNETVAAAASAGVDSVEHGAYLGQEALEAMAEAGTVWVPTLSTVGNLRGKGRFSEEAVQAIFRGMLENVADFARIGGMIAPGTDAGAWAVPHGSMTEFQYLEQALGNETKRILCHGANRIRERFAPPK